MNADPNGSQAELVRVTARLARLDLAPEEVERLGREFGRILSAFSSLAGVELAPDSVHAAPLPERTRPDQPVRDGRREALLARAPEPVEGFFGVPRTLGNEA